MQTTTPLQTLRVQRLNLSDIDEKACPAYRRTQPRSTCRPHVDSTRTFLLGEVRDGIIRKHRSAELPTALAARLARRRPRLQEAEVAWVLACVDRYRPVDETWAVLDAPLVRQSVSGDGDVKELSAWGLVSENADRSVVCVELPRFKDGGRPYDDARVAAAAYCAAFGAPAARTVSRAEPHRLREARRPDRILVFEYYADTGDRKLVFEGGPDAIRDRYLAVGLPAALRANDPAVRHAGFDCGSCAFVSDCPEVPKTPGLLGVTASRAPRGTWSATNGTKYNRCGLQDHLFRQHVNGHEPSSPERIGRAVDAALNHLHQGGRPCESRRLPATAEDWRRFGDLRRNEIELANRALEQHVNLTCPMATGLFTTQPRPQREIIAFDSAANTMVYATPDLLYLENGGLVWRETKWASRIPGDRFEPLRSRWRLQLATAVLLMADGAVPDGEPMYVELELLNARDADFVRIEVQQQAQVDRARDIVRKAVAPWRAAPGDRTATPGRHCGYCDAKDLCAAALRAGAA